MGFIRPYNYGVWLTGMGVIRPHTALLNWAKSKAFCLISYPPLHLTDCRQSLKHRCIVPSLAIFYHYINGHYSYEFAKTPCLTYRHIYCSTFHHTPQRADYLFPCKVSSRISLAIFPCLPNIDQSI